MMRNIALPALSNRKWPIYCEVHKNERLSQGREGGGGREGEGGGGREGMGGREGGREGGGGRERGRGREGEREGEGGREREKERGRERNTLKQCQSIQCVQCNINVSSFLIYDQGMCSRSNIEEREGEGEREGD